MKRRSFREIVFRARQEAANLRHFLSPPMPPDLGIPKLDGLPDPTAVVNALRGTGFAAGIEQLANEILDHRFPIFGQTIHTELDVRWRRDYAHGRESELAYFRRVRYLDFNAVGDHKWVWELNRHQHLVVLAQAYRLTGEERFLKGLSAQLESWIEGNPFLKGVNWTSALEVAFRALSWIWVYHLAGSDLEDRTRRRLLVALYQHGCFIENNLSVYFSPNTHLLGETVALHAIGALFPGFPAAGRWKQAARLVEDQMFNQVRNDGSHFEQSTYYHVYALDFFLFHRLLASAPEAYDERLRSMAEYLAAFAWPDGSIPFLGDDDGGRLFHPYGSRPEFARGTLAACSIFFDRPEWLHDPADLNPMAVWWLGEKALLPRPAAAGTHALVSRSFADSGLVAIESGETHIRLDAGPFGGARAGHSHSDTLAFVVRHRGQDLLIDPGTYTYMADPAWRNRFRGSAAHNTIRIDGLDQADPAGPFGWNNKPEVCLRQWAPEQGFLDAECRYRGWVHRRRLILIHAVLFILDTVEGPGGEHCLEQFWHPGEQVRILDSRSIAIGDCSRLLIGCGTAELSRGGDYGWRSLVFGTRLEADMIRVVRTGPAPAVLGTALLLDAESLGKQTLEIHTDGELTRLILDSGFGVEFPPQGVPRLSPIR
jgi:hypothetical protein